jgi:hypothetical protein
VVLQLIHLKIIRALKRFLLKDINAVLTRIVLYTMKIAMVTGELKMMIGVVVEQKPHHVLVSKVILVVKIHLLSSILMMMVTGVLKTITGV